MYGSAMDLDARRERALVRVESRERREQGGMNIQETPRVALHEGLGEYAHETREHDEIGRVAVDDLGERRIERRAGVEALVIHDLDRDPAAPRVVESVRIGSIRDDGGDPRRQVG